MRAQRRARGRLPLALLSLTLGCSLVVDTSDVDMPLGCPAGRFLCDGVCQDTKDPAYGCGACQACDFPDADNVTSGYAVFTCVPLPHTDGKYQCEKTRCVGNFTGQRCEVNLNVRTRCGPNPDVYCEPGEVCDEHGECEAPPER